MASLMSICSQILKMLLARTHHVRLSARVFGAVGISSWTNLVVSLAVEDAGHTHSSGCPHACISQHKKYVHNVIDRCGNHCARSRSGTSNPKECKSREWDSVAGEAQVSPHVDEEMTLMNERTEVDVRR